MEMSSVDSSETASVLSSDVKSKSPRSRSSVSAGASTCSTSKPSVIFASSSVLSVVSSSFPKSSSRLPSELCGSSLNISEKSESSKSGKSKPPASRFSSSDVSAGVSGISSFPAEFLTQTP